MSQSTTDSTANPSLNADAPSPASNGGAEWSGHPINIRLSIPLIRRRYYLTLVAGQERRRHDRRRADRDDHPIITVGNVFFSLGVATLLTLMALAALIAQSAIIE